MARSVLQAEIKKRRPFDLPEQEAFLNLQRTAIQLGGEFDRLFRTHGLTAAQFNVLRILRGTGDGGLPSLEIAERMITREPDITRLIDRLEQGGYVTRRRCTQDRRVVHVQIVEAGLKALAALDRPTLDLHKAQLGHLARAELAELSRLLVKARYRAAPPATEE